jgi:hypothetical protein
MTPSQIDDKTWYTLQRVKVLEEKLKNIKEETEEQKKQRLAQEPRECRICFYLDRGRIAGMAFSDYECRICGAQARHANTAVPRVCVICSVKYEICRRCTGDINCEMR